MDLTLLNITELTQMIRRQTGLVVSRHVSKERMIQILQNGCVPGSEFYPTAEEVSKTNDSRKRLQIYIEKNWIGIQSQLPCKGENMGRCTIYPCPEARHIDCLLAAGPQLKVHGLQT